MASFEQCEQKRQRREEKVLANRTVCHSSLPQIHHQREETSGEYTFVIGADPQLGILNGNRDWDVELEFCQKAVEYINNMRTKPAFVCMCGDIVDMEEMANVGTFGTKEECLAVQEKQYNDFSRVFSALHVDIPLLCICGNHDVGNRPTPESITRFTDRFGDDYFAFWCNHAYHICLNTNLHNDPSGAQHLFDAQHEWLKERLEYARESKADRIFLFGHHPWFLYDEDEVLEEMTGENVVPFRDSYAAVPDKYFSIRKEIRCTVLELCKEYRVNACFSGHYHQNNVSYTSWGMPMIVTGGICNFNFESTAKDISQEVNLTPGAGVRIVNVSSTKTPERAGEEGKEGQSSEDISSEDKVTPPHFLGFTHRYEEV